MLPGEGPVAAEPAGPPRTWIVARAGARWLLRVAATQRQTAALEREHALLQALAGERVRAPRPLRCSGAFSVREWVEGLVVRIPLPPALDAERARVGEELVDALAEVHAVDPRALPLRRTAEVERVLGRTTDAFDDAIRRGRLRFGGKRRRRILGLDTVGRWLRARLPPEGEPALVHGAYRPEEAIFAASGPARLAAIVDWRAAGIGDPLVDVGSLLASWPEGAGGRPELIARYEERAGRAVGDPSFYVALAIWARAVALETRFVRLADDDGDAETLREAVPALAERALAVVEGRGAV